MQDWEICACTPWSSGSTLTAFQCSSIKQRHQDLLPWALQEPAGTRGAMHFIDSMASLGAGLPALDKKLLIPKTMTCKDLRKILCHELFRAGS